MTFRYDYILFFAQIFSLQHAEKNDTKLEKKFFF